MHVDYLNVTVPLTVPDELRQSFLGLMAELQTVYKAADRQQEYWSVGTSGVFKVTERDRFTVYSASGDALQALRDKDLYESYLWLFAEHPHRVTKMDIALDITQDPQKALRKLTRRAYSENGISLTRKRIKREHVRPISSMDKFGRRTGTLYLGKRTAEAYCKVYDKRMERFDNAGIELGHDLVRYELSVTSKLGISLRDAYNPDNVFWHFMSGVVDMPHTSEPWVPGGIDFELPPRVTHLPSEALRRRIENSPELREIARLALEVGPSGLDYALSLVSRRVHSEASTLSTDDNAASEVTTEG